MFCFELTESAAVDSINDASALIAYRLITVAGMDPDNLPTSDPSKMSFGTDASGERAKPKAWKEIWGSGQGVGSVAKVMPAADLIARFRKEYTEAVDPAL